MDSPKIVVCAQGIEGFVADFGNQALAEAFAISHCPPGGEMYVLAPVRTIRRTKGGTVKAESPAVEETEDERVVAADAVIQKVLKKVKR